MWRRRCSSRARTGVGHRSEVSLEESLAPFVEPYSYGVTKSDGLFGGALPRYALYKTSDGWIAVAALESIAIELSAAECVAKPPPEVRLERRYRDPPV